ncbi:MAG: hypothetical protein AAGJ73_14110 [Pseudomonadota bacterium]
MYWFGLFFSLVFSWVSYIGAGFAIIAAVAVLVFRIFLKMKFAYWRIALLFLAPVLGLSLSAVAFAFSPTF